MSTSKKTITIIIREIDNGFIVTEKNYEIYFESLDAVWTKYFKLHPSDLGIDKRDSLLTLDVSPVVYST